PRAGRTTAGPSRPGPRRERAAGAVRRVAARVVAARVLRRWGRSTTVRPSGPAWHGVPRRRALSTGAAGLTSRLCFLDPDHSTGRRFLDRTTRESAPRGVGHCRFVARTTTVWAWSGRRAWRFGAAADARAR